MGWGPEQESRHTDDILQIASSRRSISRVHVQRAKVLAQGALLLNRHVVLLAEKDNTAFGYEAGTEQVSFTPVDAPRLPR